MECQSSDSKKLFKVFDAATKHKRTRKKHDGLDDTNSLASDSASGGRAGGASAKLSLQDVPTAHTLAADDNNGGKRDGDSSPSVSPARGDRRMCRSPPRRHRRAIKEGLSLALKSGLVSTPRSSSPRQNADGVIESIPKDQDSFIYTFLEETMKNYKKKQRHARRHEERRHSGERREASGSRERHRHHHRRRDEVVSKDRAREKVRSRKEEKSPVVYQNMLFETFAKLCAQMNEKTNACLNEPVVPRTLSHKSLQCEVVSRREAADVDHHPVRLRSNDHSPSNVSKIRSHEDFRSKLYTHDKFPINQHPDKQDKCMCCYDKGPPNPYASKINVTSSKMRTLADDGYPAYPDHMPSRNNLDACYRSRGPEPREYRNCDRDYVPERHYENDKRRYYDQKTSRSYDARREGYPEDFRRTARSDNVKEKHYDERDKYYDDKVDVLERDRYVSSKDRRVKRNIDRCDRNSIVSRDDDRDRDRLSERERDSGLSVADGEMSTVSGKSNYLRVVKQEIAEQRETMDKMMKLWKELMRCFKGLSTQNQSKSAQESQAANVQESAAAQLRLWRECMHRYETVARDVGDTDARLMEEINKQRSEMAEMATMWQECLQRYREMSSDFNSLKQQVTVTKQQFVGPESPTRQAPPVPLTCAEGEGSVPPAPYRLPNHYPQMPPMGGGGGYPPHGSPLRSRASAPPAWWWCGERGSPRRRSSPESRGSRERRHRHKERDRGDDSRYKEKSSKPSGARSEHRHRKR